MLFPIGTKSVALRSIFYMNGLGDEVGAVSISGVTQLKCPHNFLDQHVPMGKPRAIVVKAPSSHSLIISLLGIS